MQERSRGNPWPRWPRSSFGETPPPKAPMLQFPLLLLKPLVSAAAVRPGARLPVVDGPDQVAPRPDSWSAFPARIRPASRKGAASATMACHLRLDGDERVILGPTEAGVAVS